ncbi:MAG TPA: hypothetical protein DCQ99_08310 [Nitrospinae bacterium]|nr:hypothetical protein [Nitrospinota bacterium]HBA26048.1 hypothetical protein [Nitrospinota bacterium]
MNFIIKTFAVILIPLLTLNLCLPRVSSAYDGIVVADAKTTKGLPEVLATPEEDMPVEKVEKGGVSWFWIILGVVAVGGGIAAAAGGGGGSSSNSPGSSTSSGGGAAGTVTVTY